MRADQVRDQARQLRAGPGGQRGAHSLVQFRHGETAVGGGRGQDVHGGVPVGVRGPPLRRTGQRARADALVEKGQHQTVTRRTVAWPPTSTRTASAATTPDRPRAVRPAEDPLAADRTPQCSNLTTTPPATTTSTCTAMNASVPGGPHRLYTIHATSRRRTARTGPRRRSARWRTTGRSAGTAPGRSAWTAPSRR